MQMHIFKKALLPLMATAAIVGCSNDNKSIEDVVGDAGSIDTSVASGPVAIFKPSQSILPAPSDILFSGTLDGSLNIPDQPNSDKRTAPTDAELKTSPRVAFNTLDGYSTTSPITFDIGVPVDATNILNGSAVRVFLSDNATVAALGGTATAFDSGNCVFGGQADPASPACVGYDSGTKSTWSLTGNSKELVFGVDFVTTTISAVDGSTTVAILPIKPLASASNYIVMVTNGITTKADGSKIRADIEYRIAKQTAPVFYLTRDLAAELGPVQIAGIELALSLPAGAATPLFTPFSAGTALAGSDSCVFVKGVTDQIDALNALPTPIALNVETDCASNLSALSAPATANTFEGLRIQTAAREQALVEFTAANTPAVTTDEMVLTYSFSTQNIGSALLQAKGVIAAQVAPTAAAGTAITVTQVPSVNPVDSLGIDLDGAGTTFTTTSYADIYAGTLNDIPQFLDPAAPTTAIWKGDTTAWAVSASFGGGPVGDVIAASCIDALGTTASENMVQCNGYKPAKAADTSIPVLISVPKLAVVDPARAGASLGASCGTNLPITIYQHGITTNRGTLLAIADNLALQCQIVVAIDMPQHGIVAGDPTFGSLRDQNAGLYASVSERLVGSATSGAGFINLANLANSRDTFRQAVADLHSLLTAVAPTPATGMALDSGLAGKITAGVTVDQTKVSFVGMSLGGIVGMPFLAQQEGVGAAVLNVTGGGIAKILDGSVSFEPDITAGLSAAAGITKPSGDYEAFLLAAQTLVDSADPINMANQIVKPNSTDTVAGATARPILFQVVAGSNTELPDQTVPNNVFGLPTDGAVGQAFATVYAKQGSISPATYNPPNTVPGLLSGSDPITRGTAFIGIAGALAKAEAEGDAATLGALSPLLANPNSIVAFDPSGDGIADAVVTGAFLGMNLTQVDETGGATAQALVRYNTGYHGSLLDPSSDDLSNASVTAAMQLQMAGFIGTTNLGATTVFGTAQNVPAGVIAAP
jgi:hypothetical protein